jgi:phage terminase large subunit-like protein
MNIIDRALSATSRHLILREHFNHVKTSIWLDTLPDVFSWAFRDKNGDQIPFYKNDSDFYLRFDNGSEIWIGGLDEKERSEKILGTEYSTIFFNECSQLTYGSIETARSRLAENSNLINRCFYDENTPHKQHWSHRQFVEKIDPTDKTPLADPERYDMLVMNPIDNLRNIDPEFMKELNSLSKRKRDRFLLGLWQENDDSALWKYDDILRESEPPEMERIVVAIDPAITVSSTSDETGIIVAGICGNRFYVLEDVSGKYSPKAWANAAVNAYFRHHADRIIGEVNNGGDMIETTIRQVNESVSYKSVTATRGKVVRAEPVAALYEQHRGYHVGSFPELEDQMVTPFEEIEGSPDRVDALVWAATELMLGAQISTEVYSVEM